MITISSDRINRFLKACAVIVGTDHVIAPDEANYAYADALAPRDPASYAPKGAVAPGTAEEVQAIVRLAGEHEIPLWPISRGKNYGYGGSAPRISDVVMLDLMRMNRILEVNVEMGYVLLEPGVGFDDLINHLRDNNIPLWPSAPAHTWGSVLGNALERGVGYTPYGEHASKVCGLEVVTASGEILRTGMGALPNSKTWQAFPYGFGPSWDGAFMQSNFGIVTKAGIWLMPEPQGTLNLAFNMEREDGLPLAVDALRPLKLDGTIQANPSIGNSIRALSTRGPRSEFYDGEGPLPPEILDAARRKVGTGHWNFGVRLFGDPEINAINARKVRKAFENVPDITITESEWRKGQDAGRSGSPVPSLGALGIVDWLGGAGAHLTFSPVSAFSGEDAWKQYQTVKRMYNEHGFDYYGGFTAGQRYINHISMIIFDRNNTDMQNRANVLFSKLIKVAAENGWGEYRTHTLWYDEVADSYSFNNRMLNRWNEIVKNAVDPKGIIAPGKMGIWPSAYREAQK